MQTLPATTDTTPRAVAGPAPAPVGRPATDPRDDDPDPAGVAAALAAVAAGDRAAIWRFAGLADRPVRRQVQGELRRLGLPATRDDLDGLVLDAIVAIARCAGSWRPDGAAPWTWARDRVAGVVRDWAGTFADPLDEVLAARHASSAAGLTAATATWAVDPEDVVEDALATLRRVAERDRRAAQLAAALDEVASPRDAAVWLTHLEEVAAGNRRPAVTVAARFGLGEAAVRKVVQRVWQRLLALGDDDRFPDLVRLPVVAARRAA
ncbi:MAG TPA: hypothetical protein VKZ72_12055 [Acidimicrobiales bacterium]|jgi:hypothetical protein|nr:hypothetical protein [Acidimicrobiales bacterium]